ncbi:MAG: histidinol-phosphate transaminase [Planctomycetes bacterium]|nr:histidinol-phosphate transaminase [Planctomycetota bacterium]MCW8134803.1 histidinol-phosphate transaminase [Planctomycetota bacterium]
MTDTTLRYFKQQLPGLAGRYKLDVPDCPVKLNQNENAWDWPAHLKQQVFERVRDVPWNRYPPFVPAEFVARVARHLGADPAQVLVGNGSNELLYAIFVSTLERGRKVVIPQPTFTVYKLLADLLGAEVVTDGLDDEMQYDAAALERASQDAAVVVLATPNNPTGSVINPTDLEHLVFNSPALWVIDEAYFEFHGESALELAANARNLVVLRTFSKALSAAGLRFGAMVAHPEAAPVFSAAKLPYNVNIFTMAAIEVAMENAVSMKARVEEIKRERERVARHLRDFKGIKVYPSRANFLLFETGRDPRELWKAMVSRGVLVRDVSGYPRLGKALRVSIGRPEENDAFIKALEYAMTIVP